MNHEIRTGERFELVAAQVYEPLQRYLLRRVGANEAADLLSDVLLTIWRRLDDVPTESPLPWCYGVARLVVSNHRRSVGRRLRLVKRLEAQPRADEPREPESFAGDPDLAAAFDALAAADQEILRLWAWEQLEPREIAQVLPISANAAGLRLGRAKKKLAAEMARRIPTGNGHIGERHAEEQRP